MTTRDPYPFPRLENDNDFGKGTKDTQICQGGQTLTSKNRETSSRLYETKTLASARREVFHHDPQAPHDSLDFVIKSHYDHHGEFLKSKAETLFQPETVGLPHGRKLKNRSDPGKGDQKDQKFPVESVSENRESIDSVKGAIPSHHSAATNRGYSRKHDGGFYGC